MILGKRVSLIFENKDFIMNVYNSVSKEHIETFLYKLTFKLMEDVVEEQAKGMNVNDMDKYFIANFYKYAFVGLMLEWIKDGMKKDPKKIIEKLSAVIQGSIKEALNRLKIS